MPASFPVVVGIIVAAVFVVLIARWVFRPGHRPLTPEQRVGSLGSDVQGLDWRLDEHEATLRRLRDRVDALESRGTGTASSDVDDLRYELEAELSRLRERVDTLERRGPDQW
jgi:uncharacterized protein YPO0396